MFYLILLIVTAITAKSNPLEALLVWTIAIAAKHAAEEGSGKLWAYFGEIAKFEPLKTIPSAFGFILIVLPALLLQAVAAYMAFGSGTVSAFWLALLIGARIGDALLSHLIPFASGETPVEGAQKNPGLASAFVYLADGVLLTVFFQATLAANMSTAIVGASIGAGFFALVLPSLRLLAKRLR